MWDEPMQAGVRVREIWGGLGYVFWRGMRWVKEGMTKGVELVVLLSALVNYVCMYMC